MAARKKPENRTRICTVRLTKTELAEWTEAATLDRIPVAQLVRAAVRSYLNRYPTVDMRVEKDTP